MLHKEIDDYIENYSASVDEFDWEDFLDGLEDTAQKLYPSDDVDVWSWEVDNDTFEIDRAFDDVVDFAKDHTIIAYSTNWDREKENLFLTIVHKG